MLRAYHLVSPSTTPISWLLARVGPGCLRGHLRPTTLLLYIPLSPLHRRIAKTAPGTNGAPQEAGTRISESQRYPHSDPPHLIARAFFPHAPPGLDRGPSAGSCCCFAFSQSHRTLLFLAGGFLLGQRQRGWGGAGEWGKGAEGGGCA